MSTALNPESRRAALKAMAGADGLDILVIGGGVTGAPGHNCAMAVLRAGRLSTSVLDWRPKDGSSS